MKYEFPLITTISDVLPHVQGREDFTVAVKDGYTVINYLMHTSDTFRPLTGDPVEDHGSIIRRECRGIIFDNATGNIIRRPFHKFFNVNEREETLAENLDLIWSTVILEKLDGSMIVPFITSDGTVRVGTKMGETDVAVPANNFIRANRKLFLACVDLLVDGWNPIFEWMSRDNRIVIDHPVPRLVLTAIRNITDGTYKDRLGLESWAGHAGVEVVGMSGDSARDIAQFIEQTRVEVGVEGYVIRFADGHMAKCKSDWYVAIHKAKEQILYERYVLRMVLEESWDDILPFLMEDDRKHLEEYADEALRQIVKKIALIKDDSWFDVSHTSRKVFALTKMQRYGPFASIVFRNWDNISTHSKQSWDKVMVDGITALILKACNSNSGLREFKKTVGFTFDWNQRDDQ